MTLKRSIQVALAALTLGTAGIASAAVITIDFEGVGNFNAVGDYYNGGPGGNLGIQFSGPTLALVDADAGGNGNFANEPSPNTIMFFRDAQNAVLNYLTGFTTGFSFYYTSSQRFRVDVFDGLDATGTIIGSIELPPQHTSNCAGDPSGTFCNFTDAGVAFAGTAKSIRFGGGVSQTGFDDITFGSDTACRVNCDTVPEPATLVLVGAALLGLSASRRRRV